MKSVFVKTTECNTQTRRKHDFLLPQMKTENGKKVYYYQAIKMWNSLPIKCQESLSFKEFDASVSNLLVKCRSSNNEYHNEDRIINRYSIRDILCD